LPAPHPVLYLSHAVEWGGAEVVLADLWSALDRSRFAPHLACPTLGPLTERARALDVPVHMLPIGGGSPWRKALSIPRAARRVRALAAELGIRLLHANTMIAGYAAVLAAHSGPPALWHLHIAVRSRIARAFLRRADAVVAPSQAAAGQVPDAVQAGGRLHVIANGLPARFFAPRQRGALRTRLGLPADAPLCGIVGRLDPHKGHEVFLAAAAEVLHGHPGARFVVAGAAAFASSQSRVRGFDARLRERTADLGIAQAVHFLGHVDDPAALLAELDVLAVPSIAPEAAPRTIAEAMAGGCPVVASRIGGIPELVGDGARGLLVEPGNANALAAAIRRLLDQPELARQMAAAARDRARAEWTLERFARSVEAVYQRTIR
jgi:glycosyltransferase involved in cell wall biosynthesis